MLPPPSGRSSVKGSSVRSTTWVLRPQPPVASGCPRRHVTLVPGTDSVVLSYPRLESLVQTGFVRPPILGPMWSPCPLSTSNSPFL